MTELQLYKFIGNNNIEWHREKDGIYIFIDFDCLSEFTKMVNPFLSDDPFEVILREKYIGVKIDEICEYYNIDVNNIFEKE